MRRSSRLISTTGSEPQPVNLAPPIRFVHGSPNSSERFSTLRKALVCPRRSILSGADTTLALVLATTRPAGRVVQVGLGGGTTHHDRTQDNQAGGVGVGIVVGNIRELCEVIALVERGPLEPIPLEFCPLNKINEVYEGSSAMRWRVARY